MKPTVAMLVLVVPLAALAGDKPAEAKLEGEWSVPPRLAAQPQPALSPGAWRRYQDALAKVQAGAYGPATEVLNALAGEYPRVPELFATRCSAQLGLRHYAAAEADCAYALKLKPQLSPALYGLAVAEEGQGKTEVAVGHYRRYAEDAQAPYQAQALARVAVLTAAPPAVLPVAPPPQAEAAQAAAGPLGSLYVYRNHLWGRAWSQRVTLLLDGRVAGELGHAQYAELQAVAGEHLLEARFGVDTGLEVPRVLSLPVVIGADGQTYVSFDDVAGGLTLSAVPAAQGSAEVRKDCRRAFSRRL